jgi:thiamine biosynthesis lipoprotein
MSITRRRMMMISAAACLTGSGAAARSNRFSFVALGAEAQITLPGERTRAEAAMIACRAEVDRIEALFSLWNPNSALSRLNRAGRVAVSDLQFSQLLAHAQDISARSGGGFDVTVQPLWTALRDGGDMRAARRLIDWRALKVSGGEVHFARDGMAATLNGIAQGFATDRVIEILKQAGYRGALANLGEFRAMGLRPDGTPWRIGVSDPLTGDTMATHMLHGGAIATSEPNGTMVRGNAHIFDPLLRPGPRWASVTVLAKTGWRADAVSTAVAAAPIEEADALLQRCGAEAATLIATDGEIRSWKATTS